MIVRGESVILKCILASQLLPFVMDPVIARSTSDFLPHNIELANVASQLNASLLGHDDDNRTKDEQGSTTEAAGGAEEEEETMQADHAYSFLEAFLAATTDSIIRGRNTHPDVLHERGLEMTAEEKRFLEEEEASEARKLKEAADKNATIQNTSEATSFESPANAAESPESAAATSKHSEAPHTHKDSYHGFADRSFEDEPPITIVKGLPRADPEMSSYLQGTLSGPPSPPSLRELDYFNNQLGPNAQYAIGDEFNLRSAYFISTPVGEDRSVDYTRLTYTNNEIKKDNKEETILGGVIGGLAGVAGYLISKKVIFTFVGFATLLALGITGTSPHEILMNLLGHFGIGWDLSVKMQSEQNDGKTGSVAYNEAISGDALEYSLDLAKSDESGSHSPFWNSLFVKTISDLVVEFNANYFGNSLAVSAEGGKNSDSVVNVAFEPSEDLKKSSGR